MFLEFLDNKKQLKNEKIIYGQHSTPFGECLIGVISDKIAHLSFINEEHCFANIFSQFKNEWKHNELIEDKILTKITIDKIFYSKNKSEMQNLKLLLKGTHFQFEVWKTLLEIPEGTTLSYQEIAIKMRRPKSARAVAGQIAKNSIAYLIPCHRIIRKSGTLGGYRYGLKLKESLLKHEQTYATHS